MGNCIPGTIKQGTRQTLNIDMTHYEEDKPKPDTLQQISHLNFSENRTT